MIARPAAVTSGAGALDLVLAAALAWIGAAAVWLEAPAAARVVLGLPLVLFLPGYALVSLLFPSRSGLDAVERLVLAGGLSLASVPPIALAIEFSPWTLAPTPIVVALLGVVTVAGAGAGIRRSRLPREERFAAVLDLPRVSPPGRWTTSTRRLAAMALLIVGLLATSAAPVLIGRLRP